MRVSAEHTCGVHAVLPELRTHVRLGHRLLAVIAVGLCTIRLGLTAPPSSRHVLRHLSPDPWRSLPHGRGLAYGCRLLSSPCRPVVYGSQGQSTRRGTGLHCWTGRWCEAFFFHIILHEVQADPTATALNTCGSPTTLSTTLQQAAGDHPRPLELFFQSGTHLLGVVCVPGGSARLEVGDPLRLVWGLQTGVWA